MKKIICFFAFVFLLLFTATIANAQTFRAGFTLGATATDIDGMDARDGDNDFNKLGYTLGGIVSSKLNNKNDFQMEINYIKKGTEQKPDSMNNGYYKLALDYVEVPFVLRHHIHLKIRKKPVDNFDWELGASVGRLVRTTWVQDNYLYPQTDLSKINKTDVSIFIGFDYNFSSNFCLSFRYSNSVIPAVSHDKYPSYFFIYSINTGNNLVFQMSLKFMFGGSAEKE